MTNKASTQGRFVWHELLTSDVAKAKGFYGELFGWTAKDEDMGPAGTYTLFSVGDAMVAGMAKTQAGAPPHWLGYCTTPDVDATTALATKSGGKQIVAPMDIPDIGRFSIVMDPSGGVVAPFAEANESPDDGARPPVGHFCWDELVTQDPAAAKAFYTKVFGWKADEKDMGPIGTYTIWMRGERQAGGMMKAMDPKAPSAWLHYVNAGKVDPATEKAKKLGATIVMPPMDIPNVGRFSIVTDPQGVFFALFQGP